MSKINQHQESWETEFDTCVPKPLADRSPQYVELGIAKAITSKAISTERQRVLGKEREHLIQAIDELIDHETTSEMEYQKDAGKNYDPNSYGRGFSAGFVASLNLVKESLEEDEV